MGEKSELPDEKKTNGFGEKKENDSHDLNEMNVDNVEVDEEESDNDCDEELTEAEYKALDNQLNALSVALDNVEQRNDDIFQQLQQLLQSNREIRNQLEQSKNG